MIRLPHSNRKLALLAPGVFSLALVGVLMSTGCASTEDAHTSTSTRPVSSSNRSSAGQDDARYEAMSSLGYRLEWSGFAVVPPGRRIEHVELWDDIIAVHESGNSITLLETQSGRARWNTRLAGDLEKFVGLTRNRDGSIIDVAETELYILNDETGVLESRQRLAVLANTKPARYGAIMVVGGISGEILGHNLKTGFKQWGYRRNAPIEVDPVNLGRSIAVVSDDGRLIMIEPLSGSAVGESTMYDGSDSSPASGNGLIYCAARDQSLWAFPQSGGEAQWRVRTEHRLRRRPAFHEGRVFLEIPGEGLVAFDASTGDRLWSLPEAGGELVAIRDGDLIVWDGQEAFRVDPGRGGLVRRTRISGVEMMKPDEFVDGNMYVIESGGRIQKYSPR